MIAGNPFAPVLETPAADAGAPGSGVDLAAGGINRYAGDIPLPIIYGKTRAEVLPGRSSVAAVENAGSRRKDFVRIGGIDGNQSAVRRAVREPCPGRTAIRALVNLLIRGPVGVNGLRRVRGHGDGRVLRPRTGRWRSDRNPSDAAVRAFIEDRSRGRRHSGDIDRIPVGRVQSNGRYVTVIVVPDLGLGPLQPAVR